MSTENKLGPNAVWLFAATTLAVVIGATYVIPHITGPLSPKAWEAIYFALFGAGATASVVLTSTSAGRMPSSAPPLLPGCHCTTSSIFFANSKSLSVMPLAEWFCSRTSTEA